MSDIDRRRQTCENNRTERFTFRVTPETSDRIEELVDENNGCPDNVSQLLREVVKDFLLGQRLREQGQEKENQEGEA